MVDFGAGTACSLPGRTSKSTFELASTPDWFDGVPWLIEVRVPRRSRSQYCFKGRAKCRRSANIQRLTTPAGTVVDDLLVYSFASDSCIVVKPDDGRIGLERLARRDGERNQKCIPTLQLAIQGKDAVGILRKLTDVQLADIKYYTFSEGQVDGVPAIVSRTGYTGEDGFEVYAAADKAEQIWNKLLDAGNYGSETGVLPCGLAARNTLRLEAGLALYGHEIDENTTLLEANLGWICKLNKGDFIGRELCEAKRNRCAQASGRI